MNRRDLLKTLAVAPVLNWGGLASRPTGATGETSVLHPDGHHLYVAKDVAEYDGRPRGAVAAYAFDRLTGRWQPIGVQPLSLSATHPRGLAISPDGHLLIAAAYGGGIYNVLPIDREGKLNGVSAIRKEIGCGAHPTHQSSAHPHSVIFDGMGGHVISTDFGCDWVSVWRVQEDQIVRVSRVQLVPGAGPGRVTLDASGKRVNVVHELTKAVSVHRYDPASGELS